MNRMYRRELNRMEGNNMTYRLMKRLIEQAKKKGTLEKEQESIMQKLDVFLMADRISSNEYQELHGMAKEGNDE